MSREIWEVMETKAGEIRLVEVKEGRRKRKKEKETRGKEMDKEEEGKKT